MKDQSLNQLVSIYTNRAIQKIARHVAEKPEQVAASLEGFVPAIMCAIISQAEASFQDAIYITRKATEANKNKLKYSVRHLELQYQKMEDSEGFLIYIFGGNNEWMNVAESIGNQYGIGLYASTVLMQILTPVCLSNLGKTISDYDMSLSQVLSYFKTQKSALIMTEVCERKTSFSIRENVLHTKTKYNHKQRSQRTMVAFLAAGALILFNVCGYYFHLV
jgi:hypothetical protein